MLGFFLAFCPPLFCSFTKTLEKSQYLFFNTTCWRIIIFRDIIMLQIFFLFLLPLSVLTFWLWKRSLFCSPVSCLIIEDSVCLLGAPPYPLIKACVCVCLFISCYYSRYSPGALEIHKSGVPVEANTVSCLCSFSHVTKNDFLLWKKKLKQNKTKKLFTVYGFRFNSCIRFSICFCEHLNEKQQVDCPLFPLVSSSL